ncbi:Leucine-rich repeat-containing 33 [Gossypium australe]|uniref:Leucine-rich repeat-containing 33 n=1 Tax=Gossypium australe TaxID=47621 RepID=A0A5B6X4Z7_9ROSI|nr:Leucine-rich repeat-containing 33 [Gossypium australe]
MLGGMARIKWPNTPLSPKQLAKSLKDVDPQKLFEKERKQYKDELLQTYGKSYGLVGSRTNVPHEIMDPDLERAIADDVESVALVPAQRTVPEESRPATSNPEEGAKQAFYSMMND